jgi:metal-responsive CopG/Arc/MetJ family transcriptional regulator
MKRVYTYIDEDLHYKLKILVAKEKTTISEIIRQFLEQWVEEKEKEPPSK